MTKPIFDQPNILVVGGAGFIGSHLCDELVRDHKVICVDNFLTGDERNIDNLLQNPNFEFVRHDITLPLPLEAKEEGLEKFKVAWQGVQEIYYLASPTAEGDFQRYPIETLLANSLGLRNALELAVTNKAKLLYVSSDLAYGDPVDGSWRVDERRTGVADQLGPRSQYVEGKRFGEALVMAYHRHRQVVTRIARVFNTYGPRIRLTDTRLVATFCRAALTDEPITVYGGASAEASYCYVADTVKGLIKLMHQGSADPVNIGAEHPLKLVDLANEIVKRSGSASAVRVVDELPVGYYRQLIPDITRAREQLGWFPVVLLGEGLTHTIEYLRASKGLLDVKADLR